mmetsp:Transcript_31529/g.82402  ORF Transcript_31529/g.82402 Transcript_31529/m.82402 type:complete len:210 (-) Transcript_31529:271-900(-)
MLMDGSAGGHFDLAHHGANDFTQPLLAFILCPMHLLRRERKLLRSPRLAIATPDDNTGKRRTKHAAECTDEHGRRGHGGGTCALLHLGHLARVQRSPELTLHRLALNLDHVGWARGCAQHPKPALTTSAARIRHARVAIDIRHDGGLCRLRRHGNRRVGRSDGDVMHRWLVLGCHPSKRQLMGRDLREHIHSHHARRHQRPLKLLHHLA